MINPFTFFLKIDNIEYYLSQNLFEAKTSFDLCWILNCLFSNFNKVYIAFWIKSIFQLVKCQDRKS